jgi:non-heme chloroperoxidase
MKRFTTVLLVGAFAALSAGAQAQGIAGQWQGMLHTKNGDNVRTVLKISKAHAGWRANLYFIDQTPDPRPIDSIAVRGSTITFSSDQIHLSYEGNLDAAHTSLTGTWNQGNPLPMRFERATAKTAWVIDPSPHKVQFVTVDKNVKLEVLDWGGNGPPLILLSGGGDTAHVFDKFALNFTDNHHVYGITRRGFGASSWPAPTTENYTPDRLSDDVLAVMSALKIEKPVIAGHSMAGEELSSIGSRYPQKVSGLIYLDAGGPYALYTPANPASLDVDANDLRKKLDELDYGQTMVGAISDLAEALPQFEKEVTFMQKRFAAAGITPPKPGATFVPTRENEVNAAISRGRRRYTEIDCPLLAVFAMGPDDASTVGVEAQAFAALPNAKVVKLANAQHYVYRSNEADVVREMDSFMDGLPKT